jgi:hypothetical protein
MEGLEQDVGAEGDEDDGDDGVGVVMEASVQAEDVGEGVEALVFDVPAGVSHSADGVGVELIFFDGGDPEPVGGLEPIAFFDGLG